MRLTYSWRTLAGDFFGAAIAALIAMPYGLALASMMGLPPILGLVTSIATGPITALLGSNPVLIGGTASATVPFIARAVSQQGIAGAAKVCLVAALAMILFGALGLGRYLQMIPHTVVTGFSCGVGAMMVLSQLKPMLGVAVTVDRTSSNLLFQTWQVLRVAGTSRTGPIVISLIAMAVAFLAARATHRLPAPLLGVLAALGAARIFGFHEQVVGAIPVRIPALAGFAWTANDFSTILPAGIGLAVVGSVNLLLTSRVVEHFEGRHRHHTPVDSDHELRAYGVANIAAAVFGAPISVGIPARSLASIRCGASTRASNFMHSFIMLALVVFCGSLIAGLPMAALAAVTAYVGAGLLEWSTWRRLPHMRPVDASAFLITAIAVLMMNAVLAVGLGCVPYVVRWLWMSRGKLRVEKHGREAHWKNVSSAGHRLAASQSDE